MVLVNEIKSALLSGREKWRHMCKLNGAGGGVAWVLVFRWETTELADRWASWNMEETATRTKNSQPPKGSRWLPRWTGTVPGQEFMSWLLDSAWKATGSANPGCPQGNERFQLGPSYPVIPGETRAVEISHFPIVLKTPTPRKFQFPTCHFLCFQTSGEKVPPLFLTSSNLTLWEIATVRPSLVLREFIPLNSGEWVNIYYRFVISGNVWRIFRVKSSVWKG